MIDFITSVPWWGWALGFVWFCFVVFRLQTDYINKMTPEQKEAWMAEMAEKQNNKKPWYMG